VPKSIRESTAEILGAIDPSIPICVVAQVLKDGDEKVVRGAVYARIPKVRGLSFMGYVSHNLEPKGLKLGAELRWTPWVS
jgi:hypothetical protein